MNDTQDALARPTSLCAYCPKMCSSACPVSEAEGRESVTPWAKMSLVHLGRTGQARIDEPAAVKALEACTGCGACVEKCAHGNPVAETLFTSRSLANSPRAHAHREAFEKTGDVKGRDLFAALGDMPTDAHAKIAYFPGCARLGHDGAESMARDRRALSMALQTEVPACALKPGSMCCGYPLYADGQLDLVEENLIRIAGLLEGHELVVTPDPGCAYMLTTVMDALVGTRGRKKRPDVVPLVEVLAQNAHRFQDTSPGLVVRYHDPCYLARRGRTFDAPRKLLSSSTGHAPLEFAAARDEAACSGAGGLYPMSNPEGAKDVARRRALDDGNADQRVDVVATACPSARRNFERAGIRAVDVVDVVLGEVKLG